MRVVFLIFIIINILNAKSINIALSANVSYAIKPIIKEFNKKYKDIKIKTTIASSGKLTAQIINNAPYHVFMSANMKYPDKLYKKDIAITKPHVYAKGLLVILSKKKRDFSNGLNILLLNNIKRIAMANPKTAPYGKATKEALINAKIYNKIKSKFIYGESISQTFSYTLTASDLGFVAKSLLFSPKMKKFKKDINFIDLDTKLYTPIKQGIVLLKYAKNNPEAKLFYNFILSKKAKEIFKKFGYIVD